jgi:hypothetical protein
LTEPDIEPQASLGGGLTPVVAPGPLEQDEKVIGLLGGMLSINGGAIKLIVPPGAVLAKTRFTMTRVDTLYAHVELSATSLTSSQPNDVGARGFVVPVLLRMSYRNGQIPNPLSLLIAHQADDGSLNPVQSILDLPVLEVVGTLFHFSGYVMASN